MLLTLKDDSKKIIEGLISLNEVKGAINSLPTGKTPGRDRLCSEFYKKYQDALSPVLLKVFYESYHWKTVPPSFYDCQTVPIPKTKDEEQLKELTNYRPISLFKVDYEIFAKKINDRLQLVIEELIGEHQTCGIQGRSIQTNVHVARSVLEWTSDDKGQVALIKTDLAKAVDRVSRQILFAILHHIYVGTTVSEGVNLCYENCFTRIIMNNTFSKK